MDGGTEFLATGAREGFEAIRIGGAGLVARDLAAMLAFYRDVIGLEVIGTQAGRALLGAGGVAIPRTASPP